MTEQDFRDKVIGDLATIKAAIVQEDKDIVALKKCVFGNGKVGIKTQVFVLWGAFIILGGLLIQQMAK